MAEIDNLEIVISANSENASRNVRRLTSNIRLLTGEVNDSSSAADNFASSTQNASDSTEEASSRVQVLRENMQSFRSRLNSILTPLRRFNSVVGNGLRNAAIGAAHGVGNLVSRIGRILMYRAIRSLIKDMAQSFKDLYGYSDAFGTDFSDSMDTITTSMLYLRNSIAAMVSPLIDSLAPALDYIIDKVVDVLNWFNQLFAALSGADTYTVAKKYETTWKETFDTTTKKAKKTSDTLKRTILGFDEINKLNSDTSKSTTGTGKSPYSTGYKYMFETKKLDSSWTGFGDAIKSSIEDTLSAIELAVSLATVAVGAILAFSGINVPLGIAMMATGTFAAVSVIAANWDGLSDDIKYVIGAIEGIVGGALLAVGAIFAFSHANVPLGIALMALGAANMATAAVLNWDYLSGKVAVSAELVADAIKLAPLVIGAILALSGASVPLGVALMLIGATSLATTSPLQWGTMNLQIGGALSTLVSTVSSALIALGAILALTGVKVTLGVALIAAGAVGLAAASPFRWGDMNTMVSGALESLTTTVSSALLALGAILALTHISVPLGVALMAAGAVGLAVTSPFNWGGMNTSLGGALSTLTATVGASALALGAILALTSVSVPLGVALMALGAVGLATSGAFKWGNMNTMIEGALNTLTITVSSAMLAIGAILALTHISTTLGVGLIAAGAIGLAATSPFKWGGMNASISGALATLYTTVSAALLALGAILALTSVSVPLGVALMAAGAIGLVTTAPLKWGDMNTSIKGAISTLTTTVSSAALVLGALLAFTGIATPLGIALIASGAIGLVTTAPLDWGSLKTSIVSWLENIENIIASALFLLGIVSIIGGNIPLGIGLLLAGAGTIFAAGEENWNNLVQFGKDAIAKVKEGWEATNKFVVDMIIKIFGIEWDGSTDLWDWLWNHKNQSTTRQLISGEGSGANPEIKVNIKGEPSDGFDSNFGLDPTIQANLDNNPLNVSVDAQTAWGSRGQNPLNYLGLSNLSTTIGVGLRMQQSTITLTGGGGGTWRLMAQALGGIIHSNGLVQRISAYANGTANAHGTMFLAGEAGPEIVGHVGGRTEVLNKSQLAQTMFSAVRSAMSGATIQTQVYDGSGFESNDENSELMMEMIRLGSEATMQQNDLLRQQNEYLRELNDKRFTAEVSTADIIRAQSRINRRAGTTIVPIGT